MHNEVVYREYGSTRMRTAREQARIATTQRTYKNVDAVEPQPGRHEPLRARILAVLKSFNLKGKLARTEQSPRSGYVIE